ncbi:MAG: VCBS repeat-containing protein [Kiritimatiellae bacterium]|nr:VCBS repeat-containing protein [Kiritimatiellia bacterium]
MLFSRHWKVLLLFMAAPAFGQAPIVTNTTPRGGSNGVVRTANMVAQFSTNMNGATITSNRFFCYSEQRGMNRGAISFSVTTNRATLNPTRDFFPGEFVHAILTRGITNAAGTGDLKHHTWTFSASAASASGLFYEQTNYATGASPYDAGLGDLDGDGDLDLVLARPAGTQVYTNQGGLFFNTGQSLGNGYSIALADFNRDGNLDFYRGGYTEGAVYTNDGAGVFGSFGTPTTNANTEDVAAGDLTGDGYPDVIMANRDNGHGQLWTNDGAGNLSYSSSLALGTNATAAIGDLNGDGSLDSVCGNAASFLGIFTNDGTGRQVWDNQDISDPAAYGGSVALGDVNGDGQLDILFGLAGVAGEVWTNNGAGKFSDSGQALESLNVSDVELADVDGDGDLDAVFIRIIYGPGIWLNDGAGVFSNTDQSFSNTGSCYGDVGDIDGDGDLDVVTCDLGNRIRVYINEWPQMDVLGTNGVAMDNDALPSALSGTDFGGPHTPGVVITGVFTVVNTRPVPLSLAGAVTNGIGASQFRVVGLTNQVGANSSSSFRIQYRPTAPGVATASIVITNGSTNSVFIINVQGEATYPMVTNTAPANAAPAVAPIADVTAWVNQSLDGALVGTNTVRVHSGLRGYIAGSVSYSAAARTVVLNPSSSFLPGERLFAGLTRGISNAWSTAELPQFTWTFDVATLGNGEFLDGGQAVGTNYADDVALADVDGDGDLDAYLVNFDAPDEVWTNDGDGLLYDSGQRLGTNAGRFVAFGDVDRDGDLDAYVVNWQQPAILLTNDGSGVFGDSGQVLPAGPGRSVALADYDGNGSLDALVARQDQPSLVLTNDGSGLFGTNQELAVSSFLDVAVGDVDGDGLLDAVFANWNKTNALYLGNGNGTFTLTAQSLGMYSSREAALGDLDGDGDFDVFFAIDNSQGNAVWTNDGTGVFYDSGQALGTNLARGVELADFDGDGDLDALVCNYGQPNQLWTNDGRAVFGESGQQLGTNLSWHAAIGDMNGDGAVDVLVGNQNQVCELWMNTAPDLRLLGVDGSIISSGAPATQGAGTDFGRVPINTPACRTLSISNAGDGILYIESITTNGLDADRFVVTAAPSTVAPGAAESLTICFTPDAWDVFASSLTIIHNGTNSPFEINLRGRDAPARVTSVIPQNGSNAVAVSADATAYFNTNVIPGDVTADRFLLWSSLRGYLAGVVTPDALGLYATLDPSADYLAGERLFAQLTHGIGAAGGEYLEPYAWTFFAASATSRCTYAHAQDLAAASKAAAGDLNGDGWLDVALASGTIWTNDGTGAVHDSGQNTGGSGDVKLADINRNGYLDIIYENRIATNDGSGVFSLQQDLGVSNTRSLEVGDLNGDGWLDVIVGAATGANILTNDGSGRVYDSGQRLTATWVNGVAVGDVNSDGWLDIVSAYSSVRVFTNDGFGVFAQRGNYVNDGVIRSGVQLADIDGDGDLDATEAKSSSSQACRVLRNDGTGAFTAIRTFNLGSFGNDMAMGDVNGDGFVDIAVASGGNGCRMYLGDGAGQFTEIAQRFGSGSRQGVAFADMNGDRELDLLIANSSAPGVEAWLSSYTELVFLGTNTAVVANGEPASADKGTLFLETAPQGLPAAQHVFFITNPAPAEVEILSRTILGDQAAAFSFVAPPSIIDAGAVSNFAIAATPVAVGLNTAVVSLVNTGTNSPYLIPVACTGLAPVVTAILPPNGAPSVLRHTNVTVRFSWPVETNSVTPDRLFTWSESRGFNRGSIAFNGAADEATLSPGFFLRGGERVFAELMSGTTNAEGTAEIAYRIWSFYAQAEGSGVYIPSGQLLSSTDVRRAAAGDLNGDGYVDVFLVTAGSDGDRVWTNNQNGRFYGTGQSLGTNDGRYAVLGDLDNDGDLDAFVANAEQPAQVWTNDGSAVFGDSGQVLGDGAAIYAALADIDGDGDLDAIVIRQGQSAYVWLNDGSGTFTDSGQTLTAGRGLDAGDVNGDGFLDLAISKHSGSSAGQIWTNDGTGVFAHSGDFGPGLAWDIALGDVDGDLDLDLYMTVEGGGDQVWTNDGTGAFTDSGQALGTNATYDVALGDVDGDGDLDALTVNYNQPSILWTNDGTGLFFDGVQAPGTGTFWNVTLVDVDNDDDLDIYLPCETDRDQLWLNASANLRVLGTNDQPVLNEEEPSLAKGTDFGVVWRQTRATNWFSITNSGQTAVTISGVTTGGVNTGRFIVEEWPTVVDAGAVSNLAISFDPTFGGAISAIVVIANSSGVSPYNVKVQGYGLSLYLTNTIPANAALDVDPGSLLTAQFNDAADTSQITSNRFFTHTSQRGFGRGSITISSPTQARLNPTVDFRPGERVFAYMSLGITNAIGTTEITPWAWTFYASVEHGLGWFHQHQSPSNSTDSRDVALGDFDGDGDLDAWIAKDGVSDQVWTNDGTGTFYDSGQDLGSSTARGVDLADVDNDGDLDAFVANDSTAAYVWLNDGTGVFTQGQNRAMSDALDVCFADVDGDGDQDYAAGRTYYWGRIYVNNGDGTFLAPVNIGDGMYATKGPAFGDLDGDGDLDLYICDSAGYPDRVWRNNGSGGFSKFSSVDNDNGTWTELGDLDSDGDIDAFVTRSSGGNRVRFNDGAGHFTDSGQVLGSANSRKLQLGDFDADGDLDAFVANHGGANTVWTNDGSGVFGESGQALGSGASVAVAVGDLDNDGDLDAFVVNDNQDHEVWLNGTLLTLEGVAGPNGTIAPTGTTYVAEGGDASFLVTADTYYWIDELLTNGTPDAAASQARIYTSWWYGVTASGTASVTFAESLAPLGTPEIWIADYGLTNDGKTFAEAEVFDFDDDTYDANSEWIADTDPTDSNHFLRVIQINRTNSMAVVFESSTQRVYALQGCWMLATGSWTSVAGQTNIPGDASGTTALVDTNDGPIKAYRVGVFVP